MSLVPAKIMLNAAIATGAGEWINGSGREPSFDASITGTGAVSATVLIECRNIPGGPAQLYGTLTLSGTGSDAEVGPGGPAFTQYRANVTAISGTGAAVTVGGML